MSHTPQQDAALTLEENGKRPSFWQENWQKASALGLWILLITAYVWYSRANDLGPIEAVRQLLDVIRGSFYGPLIYIAVYTVRPLIFFSSAVLTLAGGFLFGPIWGVVYSLVGGNLSALLAYWVGYFFGAGILDEEQSESIIQRYAKRMRRNSFETVLIMRFLFLPFDPVSYLAGFLRVDRRAFILATFLGSIPGGVAITLAGASGDFDQGSLSLDPRVLVMAIVLFLLSLGLSRIMRRREARRDAASEPA